MEELPESSWIGLISLWDPFGPCKTWQRGGPQHLCFRLCVLGSVKMSLFPPLFWCSFHFVLHKKVVQASFLQSPLWYPGQSRTINYSNMLKHSGSFSQCARRTLVLQCSPASTVICSCSYINRHPGSSVFSTPVKYLWSSMTLNGFVSPNFRGLKLSLLSTLLVCALSFVRKIPLERYSDHLSQAPVLELD